MVGNGDASRNETGGLDAEEDNFDQELFLTGSSAIGDTADLACRKGAIYKWVVKWSTLFFLSFGPLTAS